MSLFILEKVKKNRCNNGIKDKRKCLKISKIKSIIDDGFYPIIMKLDINLTEHEAFNKEIDYIKK